MADRGRTDEARLASLETGQEQLQNELATLARSQNAFANEIRGAIKQITDRLSESQRTPWPIILTGAGVIASIVIAVVTLGMSGYVRDIGRVEGDTNNLTREFVEHIRNGHPGVVQAGVDTNAKDIIKLDETLQREMRLLDQTTQSRIDGADAKLQGEIANWANLTSKLESRLAEHSALDGHPTTASRVSALEASRSRILDWQDAHDKRVVGLNAAQWERIRALERAVYGKTMSATGAAKGSD